MIKYLLLALLLLAYTQKISATDAANSAFASALQLQKDKQYTQAIAAYESILASGQSSAQLHNNLALAYAEEGKIGKAVLHAELALILQPSLEDASQNLKALRQRIKGKPAQTQTEASRSAFSSFAGLVSPTVWAILMLLSSAAAAFALFSFAGKTRMRAVLAASIFFGLFAFFAWASAQKAARGVLMQPEIALREEANLAAKETHKIYEGTTFTILKTEGEWLQVYLNDGAIGWLPRVTSYELRMTNDE